MAVNAELVAVVWWEEFAGRLQAKPRRLIEAGAPEIYEYRIARDESGAPIRNEDGEVVTAFGPRDHSSTEQWEKIQRYWLLLRIAEKLPWL